MIYCVRIFKKYVYVSDLSKGRAAEIKPTLVQGPLTFKPDGLLARNGRCIDVLFKDSKFLGQTYEHEVYATETMDDGFPKPG